MLVQNITKTDYLENKEPKFFGSQIGFFWNGEALMFCEELFTAGEAYNNKCIAKHNMSVSEYILLHELCHWLFATEAERLKTDFDTTYNPEWRQNQTERFVFMFAYFVLNIKD